MSYRRSATVYTDGACSNNGYDGARAGYGVYWGDGDSRNTSAPHYGRQTNNSAEIEGATQAIEQAKAQGYDRVTVKTDSQFLTKGATEWMPRWEQNGWRTAAGHEVKNREDFQRLGNAMKDVDVRFEHTPGHAGNRGNEAADRLARQGANKRY